MGSDLNNFFVTFNIFRDGVQVHSIEAPKSMINQMFTTWVYPDSPYSVKVVDDTGNFRIDSNIFN